MYEESDDFLSDWFRPTNRTSAERKIYGPSLVNEKIALLREFHKKVHKKPELLEEVRADLAEREAAHPEKSRYRLRLRVIHDHMKKNKKLGMKSKYFKGPGVGIYELFKGRKIVDDIFGNDLLVNEIEKYNAMQGIVDVSASPEKPRGVKTKKASPKPIKKASPAKTKKASPKPVKKASPAKTEKRKRCPNGTRRNKKTGKCEPKK
jgi:hypothetical protein